MTSKTKGVPDKAKVKGVSGAGESDNSSMGKGTKRRSAADREATPVSGDSQGSHTQQERRKRPRECPASSSSASLSSLSSCEEAEELGDLESLAQSVAQNHAYLPGVRPVEFVYWVSMVAKYHQHSAYSPDRLLALVRRTKAGQSFPTRAPEDWGCSDESLAQYFDAVLEMLPPSDPILDTKLYQTWRSQGEEEEAEPAR
jgi:hypothetical protein